MKKFIIFFLVTLFLFLYPIHHTLYPTYAASEEQAIYNLNNGLFPDEVKTKQEPSNILTNIKNLLGSLVGIFIHPDFSNKEKAYANSDNLQQATIPDKYKPDPRGNPLENLKRFLGGSTGFYGQQLPPQMQTDNVGQSEKNYEQSNFPDGVKPITQ